MGCDKSKSLVTCSLSDTTINHAPDPMLFLPHIPHMAATIMTWTQHPSLIQQ